jgi:hypothetical protein
MGGSREVIIAGDVIDVTRTGNLEKHHSIVNPDPSTDDPNPTTVAQPVHQLSAQDLMADNQGIFICIFNMYVSVTNTHCHKHSHLHHFYHHHHYYHYYYPHHHYHHHHHHFHHNHNHYHYYHHYHHHYHYQLNI